MAENLNPFFGDTDLRTLTCDLPLWMEGHLSLHQGLNSNGNANVTVWLALKHVFSHVHAFLSFFFFFFSAREQ